MKRRARRTAERRARKAPGRLRAWALNLATLAVSVGLLLAAVEVVMRFAAHRILSGGEWLAAGTIFRIGDHPVGFSLEPGSTRIITTGEAFTNRDRINSLGLNDAERSVEKPPGTRRILMLGDSFIFGQGVPREKTVASLLEERLGGVEVINAGIPGYCLDQEYLFYKDRGHRLEPDLVLVGFFVNDLEPPRFEMELTRGEDGLPARFTPTEGTLRRQQESVARSAISGWLRSHSLFYVLVRNRLDNLLFRLGNPDRSREETAEAPAFAPIFLVEPDEEISGKWESAFRTLDAFEDLVRAYGADLALLSIPSPNQISEEEFDRWGRARGLDPSRYSRRKPYEMLSAWCERSGTPCLDLLTTFEGRDRDRYYFRWDLHWTPEGHRLAADAVEAFLESLGQI